MSELLERLYNRIDFLGEAVEQQKKKNGVGRAAVGIAGAGLVGASTGTTVGTQRQLSKIRNRASDYVRKKGGHLIDNRVHVFPDKPFGTPQNQQALINKANKINHGLTKFVNRSKGTINKAAVKGGLKGAAIGAGIGLAAAGAKKAYDHFNNKKK